MKKFENGFDKHLGYTLDLQNELESKVSLEIKEEHKNIYGYVHGGVFYSLGDVASGYVATATKDTWVTLNGSINYLKASKEGSLKAYAKQISKTNSTMVIEVKIYNDKEVLLCNAVYTMYKIKETTN